MMPQSMVLRHELGSLLDDYVATIDDDRLESWPEMFVEDCLYEIISRENESVGLTAPVMYCDSAAMLRDRVLSLRNANIYSMQSYKHFLGALKILDEKEDAVRFSSNYLVINTRENGTSVIYQTGTYRDEAIRIDGAWKFKSKRVIYDTARVQTALAYPI